MGMQEDENLNALFLLQVVIRGELPADSDPSETLAIDDLSFSRGCVAVPGNVTINVTSDFCFFFSQTQYTFPP